MPGAIRMRRLNLKNPIVSLLSSSCSGERFKLFAEQLDHARFGGVERCVA
jgi:hypothetical protein